MSAPESVDLTAAAKEVVYWYDHDIGESHDWAVLVLWQSLTGISGEDETIAHARATAAADPPVTAHIPPC